MEISDNGYGIKKEPGFIESIFVDYVTTKASTEGSGMGLSRVRKIIQMHKGRIWAESEGKEKGARFIVELPIHHGSADPVTKGKR
jgi:signal transduction histidine kinase